MTGVALIGIGVYTVRAEEVDGQVYLWVASALALVTTVGIALHNAS
ncbi:MAG: hypothetical protein ABEI99_01990 [Halobaculum sp.]